MPRLLKQFKIWTGFLMVASLLVPFGPNGAVTLKSNFPKRANYFLSWELSEETARGLAKWDLVILDMEHQIKNREKIDLMRQLNPNIMILAYITSQEIRDDAVSEGVKPYTPLRFDLASGIKDFWWLKSPYGAKVGWWSGTHLLNITASAPATEEQNWSEYLAQFINNKILSSGAWNGIFFDNTWNSLTEKVGANLDINGDGAAETREAIESSYRQGLNNFFNRVRNLSNDQYILMGNDGEIYSGLNGMMFENFPYARGWSRMMQDYNSFPNRAESDPKFSLINANTANAGGRDDYQKMRYGLTSSLLSNGFYSFDLGDRDHGQIWWYDEYDTSLGRPTGAPYLSKNRSPDFNNRGLWRRDFQNGLVLVNSGNLNETIDLNAEYEKLKGPQDPQTNDGLIVSTVEIPPQDGLILLRPLDKITNTFFSNGSFARIYNSSGHPLRNGFFVYDNRFRGNQSVYLEQTNDGLPVITVATDRNQIKILENDELKIEFFPFGPKFGANLSLALADLENDGKKELVVGMAGTGTEIRIFDLQGNIKKIITPFPKSYKQGVSVAVGNLNGSGNQEIVVALAKSRSLIKIFSNEGKLVSGGFYAFGKNFNGGVNLAAGDINGDGRDEIIAGAGIGKPEIRIFNDKTKQLASFLGGSSKVKNGVKVTAADVDEDGKDEIISLSTDVFTTVMKQ